MLDALEKSQWATLLQYAWESCCEYNPSNPINPMGMREYDCGHEEETGNSFYCEHCGREVCRYCVAEVDDDEHMVCTQCFYYCDRCERRFSDMSGQLICESCQYYYCPNCTPECDRCGRKSSYCPNCLEERDDTFAGLTRAWYCDGCKVYCEKCFSPFAVFVAHSECSECRRYLCESHYQKCSVGGCEVVRPTCSDCSTYEHRWKCDMHRRQEVMNGAAGRFIVSGRYGGEMRFVFEQIRYPTEDGVEIAF